MLRNASANGVSASPSAVVSRDESILISAGLAYERCTLDDGASTTEQSLSPRASATARAMSARLRRSGPPMLNVPAAAAAAGCPATKAATTRTMSATYTCRGFRAVVTAQGEGD
eukprot:362868-Chlamydomonas_euryale.AAC.1